MIVLGLGRVRLVTACRVSPEVSGDFCGAFFRQQLRRNIKAKFKNNKAGILNPDFIGLD
jgi:hypothetical protein